MTRRVTGQAEASARRSVQPDEFCAAGLGSTVVLPITTRVVPDAFPLRVLLPKGTCGLTHERPLVLSVGEWLSLLASCVIPTVRSRRVSLIPTDGSGRPAD